MVTEEKSLVPAVPPKELSEEQASEIRNQADKVVASLMDAKGSEALTIEDQISGIGIKDQKNVAAGVALLQEKMGNVFYSDNKSAVTENMTKDINELQGVLAKINPKDIQKEARYRIIKMVPFLGSWIVNVLRTASQRGQTLQEFVEHLERSLKQGETMLRQDNAQLKVMYKDVEGKQSLIAENAYFAEVLMEKLQEALDAETEEKKKKSLQKVLFNVSTRAQDLRAMENIHEQFFVSIEMTRDNNSALIATTQRMLTMGMNVVFVAMAIYSALQRAKKVKEVAVGTGQFIGKMMVTNATMINNMAIEIGDIMKNPFIPMEMLEKSCEELKGAIDTASRIKGEAIENARINVVKIKDITEEMKTKAGLIIDSDVKSLEASKTLQLTEGKESK